MSKVLGKTIHYTYNNGESYTVSFSEVGATWKAVEGPAKGATGTESYDAIEVADNIIFVSWLEDNGEVVSYVLNLNDMKIYCSHVFEKDREFLQGQISSID